ncbi:MAG TPA: purine-nucleoside phosphorylase [Candidatus Acidoferrales bacterium]|nr:purine-nucleoside phosphorylase [Candidatus Acidoferrales bacterium]
MSTRKRAGGAGDRSNLFARAERAAKFVLARARVAAGAGPRIGVILGSGLGAFAGELTGAASIPYGKIPGFPVSTVEGHAGRVVIGRVAKNGAAGGERVAVLDGRLHFYEGYSMDEVTFPVRVLGLMGIRALIITNAAGGISPDYQQGALVLIRDHLNCQGTNPLIGHNDARFGLRFPDMTQAYSSRLRRIAREEGKRQGITLPDGVYAAVTGPSFETPAEIRALRTLGADLVGMSTAPEVIVARQMGIEVLGISCVTNLAAGILDQPITHEEVLETGARVRGQFAALVGALILRIAAEL